MLQLPGSITLFYYITFTDAQKQKTSNLLSSLLAQLHLRMPYLRPILNFYHKFNSTQPSVDAMKACFAAAVGHISTTKTYILIDALDESPQDIQNSERSNTLTWLEDLSHKSMSNVHVLCTSRRSPDIEEVMRIEHRAIEISIEEAQTSVDIERYVTAEIERDRNLRRLTTSLQKKITDVISQKAHGM